MKLPVQTQPLVRSHQPVPPVQTAPGSVQPSAKGACYFHHNCPDDGYIDTITKRQCANGGGYSWMNPRGGCENLRK